MQLPNNQIKGAWIKISILYKLREKTQTVTSNDERKASSSASREMTLIRLQLWWTNSSGRGDTIYCLHKVKVHTTSRRWRRQSVRGSLCSVRAPAFFYSITVLWCWTGSHKKEKSQKSKSVNTKLKEILWAYW